MAEQSLWSHLPLLVRANSKDSVEYILEAIWRTRHVGLDATDRDIIRDMLQLPSDSDLDPRCQLRELLFQHCYFHVIMSQFTLAIDSVDTKLLVCLRMLIRRCVYENASKDEIQKFFPSEVEPEIQRLLTLLLQKFHREWREDMSKEQVTSPRLKAMTWNIGNEGPDLDSTDPLSVMNLKGDSRSKETLETMLNSMYSRRDQLSETGEAS